MNCFPIADSPLAALLGVRGALFIFGLTWSDSIVNDLAMGANAPSEVGVLILVFSSVDRAPWTLEKIV